jgi:HAD superfamily hydrolase (TIGR01509 family)
VFRGAIFDVDGVLVDSPHERAWRESLQSLMESPAWASIRQASTWSPEAFTSLVYETELSGKPREAGALAALQYFHVPDAQAHVQEYADAKQARLEQLIQAGDFHAYDDAVRFVFNVHNRGLRTVSASSSKNARAFLERVNLQSILGQAEIQAHNLNQTSTLLDVLDTDVSGRDFPHGKPAPDIFLAAAAQLGEEPAVCFVVEDAVSGIQAARAGGMAGLGTARRDDVDMLQEAGATLVVTSLDDVDLDELTQGTLVKKGTTEAAR